MKLKRLLSIEILRVFLIYLIILHHFILHGTGLIKAFSSQVNYSPDLLPQLALLGLTSIAPVCFIFLSGFFGIAFKMKRAISLILLANIYSLSIFLIVKAFNIFPIEAYDIVRALLPIPTDIWWFLSVYIFLYFISPILNLGVKNLPSKELIFVMSALFLFSNGFGYIFNHDTFGANTGLSIVNSVVVYLLGRFTKERLPYKELLNRIKTPVILFLFLLTTSLTSICLILAWKYKSSQGATRIIDYRNPLIILSAILLFFLFYKLANTERKANFFEKILLGLSSSVLGIYLFHEHYFMRTLIYKKLLKIPLYSENPSLINLMFYSFALMLIAGSIENLRLYLSKYLKRKQ